MNKMAGVDKSVENGLKSEVSQMVSKPMKCTSSRRAKQWKDDLSEDLSTPSCMCSHEEKNYNCQKMFKIRNTSETLNSKSDLKRNFKTLKNFTGMDKQISDTFSETVYEEASDITTPTDAVEYRSKITKGSKLRCDFIDPNNYNEDNGILRLTKSREHDYNRVDNDLKVVIALSGYPKSKVQIYHLRNFNKCIRDIIDMQIKAHILKYPPMFLDCYINKGAIVCIFKDIDSRRWIVMVSSGLQERMKCDLIFLETVAVRLYYARMVIPQINWPTTATDAFKLMKYFNPELKTNEWKIIAKTLLCSVEYTFFIIDQTSIQIIRNETFKNVIDKNQMEFGIAGYTEVYSKTIPMNNYFSSIPTRIKILNKLRSYNRGLPTHYVPNVYYYRYGKKVHLNCGKTYSASVAIRGDQNVFNITKYDHKVKETESDRRDYDGVEFQAKDNSALTYVLGLLSNSVQILNQEEMVFPEDEDTIVVSYNVKYLNNAQLLDEEEIVAIILHDLVQLTEGPKIIVFSNAINCKTCNHVFHSDFDDVSKNREPTVSFCEVKYKTSEQALKSEKTVLCTLDDSVRLSKDQEIIAVSTSVKCEKNNHVLDPVETVGCTKHTSVQMSEGQKITAFSTDVKCTKGEQVSYPEETVACTLYSIQPNKDQETKVVSSDINSKKKEKVSDPVDCATYDLVKMPKDNDIKALLGDVKCENGDLVTDPQETVTYTNLYDSLQLSEDQQTKVSLNYFKRENNEKISNPEEITSCSLNASIQYYDDEDKVTTTTNDIQSNNQSEDLETKIEKTVVKGNSTKNTNYKTSNESGLGDSDHSFEIYSKKGLSYYRKTNYLHISEALKTAMVLEDYPECKLEWPHMQHIQKIFNEHVKKEANLLNFSNETSFLDFYLSNGALLFICDSAEIKQYLQNLLPTFILKTGLKLNFINIKYLVTFTTVVMTLRKELSHMESKTILLMLQMSYPELNVNQWMHYYNIPGERNRVFGVDPKFLEVLETSDFINMYEGYGITFNLMNRYDSPVEKETTEYRGNVKIVYMALETSRSFPEVLSILQHQNPRLRTKFWRKISTVKSKILEVVLLVDILSAQVIISDQFNSFVENAMVKFTFGSYRVNSQVLTLNNPQEYANKNMTDRNDDSDEIDNSEHCILMNENNDVNNILYYKGNENYDIMKSIGIINEYDYCKADLKIPTSILPAKGCLDIIFHLINEKNLKLNTDLWRVDPASNARAGHFSVLIDKMSANVIKGDDFDGILGGEEIIFQF